ncbi:Crp/Fnr family transcriptional regulator [Rhodovastum atsumiense]|uniref:Crp/Fnr family transcriptional regulator n=2 Tax=Rhodovastum atsumiense TaxID=504468 RepID=A0A5M6IZG5_9PROT|nr:Crp/Fnr family transcriptional regulator [Rhodovastum atsumiense]
MRSDPSFLHILASEEAAPLRARFRERVLGGGTLLDTADPERDSVFVVTRGRLRIFLATSERELSLAYLEPGDVFSTHTRARIIAVEPTTLLLADRRIIERELLGQPALQASVLRVLARVLGRAITLIEDLAFHTVRGRLARYLLRTAARRGETTPQGPRIRFDMPMEEIATLLGTTRQSVSTELNAMIRCGAIQRPDRRHLLLCDHARLRGWAEGDAVGWLTDGAADPV